MAQQNTDGVTRRDFLYVATGTVGAVGAAFAAWPFIAQMNPSSAAQALATTEVDVSSVQPGSILIVSWRKQPVFIRRRTAEEVAAARAVDVATLPDPQSDADRVMKDEWLVVVGVCTHLGCVPPDPKLGGSPGDFGGWFCPCHGSHYDTSGRIRKGPAPKNLLVPNYRFASDTVIVIGEGKTPAEMRAEQGVAS